MLQKGRFSGLTADSIESFVTDLLARQEIACAKEQEEGHQHRTIEGTAAQASTQHGGSELGSLTSLVVIRRPLVIEVEAKMAEQLLYRRLAFHPEACFTSPNLGIARTWRLRRSVEIEGRDNRRKIGKLVACGPKCPNLTRATVGRGHD